MTGSTELPTAGVLPARQRGLWFLDRLTPGTPAYTVPWVLDFDGPIDLDLLRAAVGHVVGRHAALRSTFPLTGDGPAVVVRDTVEVPFMVVDTADRDAVLDRLAREGFDLAEGPLIRVTAIRTPARTSLFVAVHHIVWDGWSEGLFLRELAETYRAFADGGTPDLPTLPESIPEPDPAGQLDYWRQRLAGAPASLDLPTDRPRPTTQTFAGDTVAFRGAEGTSAAVRALAEAEGATPFMILIAAFAALMSRHTGTDDLVIGTPVTTRTAPELAAAIGYHVTMLPVRVRVDRAGSFRRLVGQVSDALFEDYTYAELPFDAIVDALDLDRGVDAAPLVQVVFGMHEVAGAGVDFGTATATGALWRNGTAKYDLTWSCYEDTELRGEVEYRTDLFDATTIAGLLQGWHTLLAEVLATPDAPLRTLAEPVPAVRPAVVAPVHGCLHERFEDAADRFPDRPAVTFGDRTLTYAELDARANRLAAALAAAGVRHGDRVGLLLDRTDHVPAAILAVLKSGAAYVPVDLTTPADRAAFLFADTGSRVVLVDQDDAPTGVWRVLDLRDPALDAYPATRPAVGAEPADIAYLIYTSGSTGAPKGVAVAHEHVARLLDSGRDRFGFTEHGTWTLFHSYAFDWTVWELWAPLHHGARLVVVPYLTSRSPEDFVALLDREAVTHLCQTPSALRQVEPVLRATGTGPRTVERVMLGGEALDPALVRRWFDLAGAPPLCNLYGITETTVHVTANDVAGTAEFGRSLVGEPLAHLSLRVLDPWLRPCPPGVTGELYVGGGSLAHGYWGRPGLTGSCFVPDPEVPGARLYRTGDLARHLPDGGLEYLGRGDDQVKVRGFRIELGEIEAALSAHSDVDDCVVVVRDQTLSAYVTATAPVSDLRGFLARTLPDHMIPVTFTVLDTFPLTVNGKVDRRALPEPDAPTATGGRAAQTPAELALVEAVTAVLEVAGVSVADNFFHLGGDSIRAVQLAGGLHDRGWSMALPDVFRAPTLSELAALLRPADGAVARSEAFDLVADTSTLPAGVVDAYPLVAMQLSMIYHMELSGGAGSYHNVNSFRVRGAFDEDGFRAAVAGVIARHPVLRTSFDLYGHREPLQLVHAHAHARLDIRDLRGHPDPDGAIRAVFEQHIDARFDLTEAPLFRATVQRLDGDEFQLTIAEHHAILDGWSFTSLLTEILERHADPTIAPAPPRATFRDFVAAERAASQSPRAESFWSRRLDGVNARLWPGQAADDEVPRTVEHLLAAAPAQLTAVAAGAEVPMKAVALAAHVLALRAVTGIERVVTGLSVNGRLEQEDATLAYGLFLNTVPLVAPDADGLDLVRALHADEVEMLPHRRVPFATLARYLTDTRLDANFAFLRFHSLGRLAGAANRIVDDAIGCEPTLRYEPTHFPLGVALVQDPTSGRSLLAVDHLPGVVPDGAADQYADSFIAALSDLAARLR